jgi:peptidoglycan/LPS O-acetylase OafA/YrhL
MRPAFFAELPFLATYTSNWVEITTLFGITWSLATEEQFYLVWPLIERFLARWIGAILGAGLLINQCINFGWLDGPIESLVGLPRSQVAVLQTTFTPILLGAALAHGLSNPACFARIARAVGMRAAGPLALAAVLALASLPGGVEGAPRLAVHVAMTALVAACVVREDNGLRALLSARPAARIGAVSYGIYLYHLIALDLVRRIVGDGASNPVRFAACLALSVLIAEISYRVLEMPFLRLKGRFEATVGR